MYTNRLVIQTVFVAICSLVAEPAICKEVDAIGRQIMRGPLPSGVYSFVHIISDSVGIDGGYGPVTVTNSVIEAPICVRTSGIDIAVTNSKLLCQLCIQYTTEGMRMGNVFIDDICAGQWSN